ncbi:MAG: NTF2-like N-terminal transpeptidase domain-containing protein, partial [Mycobacteriaceae bacterium]
MTFLGVKQQWVSVVVSGVLVAVSLVGCTSNPDGPEAIASSFLSALADGDTEAAAALADRPVEAKVVLDAVWQGLQAQSLESTVNSSRYSHGVGTVDVSYQWHLPKDRVWKYTNQIQVVESDGQWKVRWTATDIHPKLGDLQRMELRADPAKRASVNERAGSDVLIPGRVVRVKFNPTEAKDIARTADLLALTLKRFDDSLTGRAIAESATAVQGDYLVRVLSSDDFESVRAPLVGLDGVSFTEEADLVPTDPTFAPDIVGQVKKAVIAQVDGMAGWRVV